MDRYVGKDSLDKSGIWHDEVEWDGEMELTEDQMRDSIKSTLLGPNGELYQGPGAYTVSELAQIMDRCETTARTAANHRVKQGKLIKVRVRRITADRNICYPTAYVETPIYDAFMESSGEKV